MLQIIVHINTDVDIDIFTCAHAHLCVPVLIPSVLGVHYINTAMY